MGMVISIAQQSFFKRWRHKLFDCPTFWRKKPAFKCPICGRTYRCYWDGHDVSGMGIDLCGKCASKYEN